MKAKKENKVYTITENEKKRYLDTGYDIYDDDGNLTEHSPLKKIAYAEYARLSAAHEELSARYAALVNNAPPEPAAEPEPEAEAKKGKAATKKVGE